MVKLAAKESIPGEILHSSWAAGYYNDSIKAAQSEFKEQTLQNSGKLDIFSSAYVLPQVNA